MTTTDTLLADLADVLDRASKLAKDLSATLAGPSVGYSFVYHVEIGLLFLTLVIIGPLVRASTGEDHVASTRFGLAEFPG